MAKIKTKIIKYWKLKGLLIYHPKYKDYEYNYDISPKDLCDCLDYVLEQINKNE